MDDRITLKCQACGDAENCNFCCELVIGKNLVELDKLLCPISGEECEWYEVEQALKEDAPV